MRSNGTVRSIHAGRNTPGGVTKDVAREDVEGPENDDQDAGGDDDAPKGHAERFLACGLFVKVSKDGNADDDHRHAKSDEARRRRVERPAPSNIIAEQGEFGDDEKHAEHSGDNVADGIKKEELGNDEGLNQHDGTCGNNGDETYDVHHTDDVEDDVAWTSQRSL